MSGARHPRPGMNQFLAIATLGLSAGMGAATLPPATCEERGRDDRPECATPAEPRRVGPDAAREKLSYLFWV